MIDARVVLGLTPSATLEEAKARYRKLAMLFHPDHNDSEVANEMMRIINLAYAAIVNPPPAPRVAPQQPQNPPRPTYGPPRRRVQDPRKKWSRWSRIPGDACDWAVPFKKHKGETLGEILQSDYEYIEWAIRNFDPSDEAYELIIQAVSHYEQRRASCGW